MKFKDGSNRRPDPLWVCLALGVILGGALIAVVVASGSRSQLETVREDAAPTFTLQLEIVDGETGEPVPATVLLDGEVLAEGVTSLEREVPLLRTDPDRRCLEKNNGDASACPGVRQLDVRAPGYKPWGMAFRAHVNPGRTIGGLVRLKRQQEAKTAPDFVDLIIDGPHRTAYLDALLPLIDGA